MSKIKFKNGDFITINEDNCSRKEAKFPLETMLDELYKLTFREKLLVWSLTIITLLFIVPAIRHIVTYKQEDYEKSI